MAEQNVTFLGDIADSYDELVAYDEKALDHWVDDLIEANDGSEWGSFKMYAGMGAAAGVSALMKFSQGFVDVGRLGNGVLKDRSLAGAGKDALRLLNFAGPIGKGLGTVGKVLQVTQKAGQNTCAWVAFTNSLRVTGQRFFLPMEKLVEAAGGNLKAIVAAGRGTDDYALMLTWLGKVGIPFKVWARPAGATGTLDDLGRFITQNPNGAVTISIRFVQNGAEKAHRVVGLMDKARGLVFRDPHNPHAVINGLAGLRAHFKDAAIYVSPSPVIFIPNAIVLTEAARYVSELAMIATQLVAVAPVQARDPQTARQVMLMRAAFAKAPPPKPPKTAAAAAPAGAIGYYEVKPGDWLSKIAKRPEYYGDMHKWPLIYYANLRTIGRNPDLIKPGQVLLIPRLPAA